MFFVTQKRITNQSSSRKNIELVRGWRFVTIGPQFMEIINYVLKREQNKKKISFETQNTAEAIT
jgi:hypothetical protein